VRGLYHTALPPPFSLPRSLRLSGLRVAKVPGNTCALCGFYKPRPTLTSTGLNAEQQASSTCGALLTYGAAFSRSERKNNWDAVWQSPWPIAPVSGPPVAVSSCVPDISLSHTHSDSLSNTRVQELLLHGRLCSSRFLCRPAESHDVKRQAFELWH
jgi:hypothetical protein